MFDLQIKNEEKFAQNEEMFTRNEERFAKLVESQAGTDRRLNALIATIKEGPNGDDARDSQA